MKTSGFPFKMLLYISLFAIAMGFLETTVVVYLRALLYPNGFAFPLMSMPESLAITEILREASTLIIIWSIGYIAGKNLNTRFAWFLYIFAIWDIFYYVFLKLLLNWPQSWLTWDILFLIPTTWVGPVITPIIVSISMIVLAILIIKANSNNSMVKIKSLEWILLILGSITLIVSFIWEYSEFILDKYSLKQLWTVPTSTISQYAQTYIPHKFNWFLFITGQFVIFIAIGLFWKRTRKG
jgi:hypothetical protein